MNLKFNPAVTSFLDTLDHPFRAEIEVLRSIILGVDVRLAESVKWNAPNYSVGGNDRLTLRILPPKQVQLIFHRGAKTNETPLKHEINDAAKLLEWKGYDRAVVAFSDMETLKKYSTPLTELIEAWLAATL